MGIKLNDPSKMNTPGPGNYKSDANFTTKKAPGYSMGSKLQSDLDLLTKETKPGPGQYAQSSTALPKNGPKYGFGSGKKSVIDARSKSMTPGPGHYHIPYTVSDVPEYQHARNNEFKYI